MPGCPVVALWGVTQHGQSPGEGRLQKSPGLPGLAADQGQRCGGWRGWVPVRRVRADRLYRRIETGSAGDAGIDGERH